MGHKQQAAGSGFESAFKVMANLCGFKVIKIPAMGLWFGPGAFKPINGWSDFMLVAQDGRTAFIDTKTTIETSFPYSKIERHQLEFFQAVGDLCPAGYIVNFVAFNTVIFFDWRVLLSVNSGSSLSPKDGIVLGRVPQLRVQDIMTAVKRDEVA